MNSVKLQDAKLIYRNLVASLFTNNELSEGEMKKTIPFTTVSKRMKYLGISLPKEVKDQYSKKFKIWMKEIDNDTNRWKYIPCSWIRRPYIVKNDHTTQGNL